jgi:hypothetical protein
MINDISWEGTPRYIPSNRTTGSKDKADRRDHNKNKSPESYDTASTYKSMKFSFEKTDNCNKHQASSFHWCKTC